MSYGVQCLAHSMAAIDLALKEEDKEFLSSPFTSEEIFNALKHIHPCKAPGPDGM